MTRRRRELAPPPADLPGLQASVSAVDDEPQLELIDFTDPTVRRWEEAKRIFGNPEDRGHQESEMGGDQVIDHVAKLPALMEESKGSRVRVSTLNTPECLVLLKKHDFDAMEFVRKIFVNEPLGQYEVAINHFGVADEHSSKSLRQAVAENIHNYVKAQKDLLDTKEQFRLKQFPGQEDVERLYQQIVVIRDHMKEFFTEISRQAKTAQDASALLARISSYSFIFQLAAEIERHRSLGQFDEIARMLKKTRQFPFLKKIPLFAQALKSIDRSLTNVNYSLKKKLENMTYATFNKSHCRLMLTIQHEGNPMVEILGFTVNRVNDSFAIDNLAHQCSVMEETLKFWQVLCDFFVEHDKNMYNQSLPQIEAMLAKMITDFDDHTFGILKHVRDSVPPGKGFNTELHQNVRKIYNLWQTPCPSEASTKQVEEIKTKLQKWYTEYLHEGFKVVLSGPDPGLKLTEFLQLLLDQGDLFSTDMYKTLIVEPIFCLFDNIHESAVMKGEADLVKSIMTLKALIDVNLDRLIIKYNTLIKENFIDPDNCILKIVGQELNKMMMNQLLRTLIVDLNSAIYHGIYGTNIEWSSEEVPIQPDGYAVYVINRCIECKNAWGILYDSLEDAIVDHIASSIINALMKMRDISVAGQQRLELNVMILKRAFGPRAPQVWSQAEKLLGELQTTSPTKEQRAIMLAHFKENSARMALQLKALATPAA